MMVSEVLFSASGIVLPPRRFFYRNSNYLKKMAVQQMNVKTTLMRRATEDK